MFELLSRRYLDASDGRTIVGLPYAEAFPEFVTQGHKDVLDGIYASAEPFTASAVRADTPHRPGGPPEERYWNVAWVPTRASDGSVDGVATYGFEITDEVVGRRVAESAQQLFDDLVRAVHALAWKVDPVDWRPTWISGASEDILGCSRQAATNPACWWDPIHPEDRPAVEKARSAASVGGAYDLEYRVSDPNGGWRWLSESGRHLAANEARTPRVMGLTVDVTGRRALQAERERIQTQLLQVQKLESLGLLAGGIAHDFNNLLTAILGNASLAEALIPPTHAAARPLTAMVSAAHRAAELTRQLLAYSGRGHFRIEVVAINDRIRELAELLEATLPKKVQLRLSLTEGLPPIEADVAQLQQVLMNLVINGADALGDQTGTVIVHTGTHDVDADYLRANGHVGGAAPGPYVYVEVTDNGAGMPHETVARIFDPFFTTKADGRGLGLAAVQGIIRGHRGLIRVYSEVGRGTTFKVMLPATGASMPDNAVPSAAPPADHRGIVLVIDDEAAVRDVARAMLESHGYRVIEAPDGPQGIALFETRANDITLVLLDLTMPHMGGEEVFRAIRGLRGDVRVLLSSGYNEIEATRRMVGRGHAGFLQKPYTLTQLMAAVNTALGAVPR